jgi:hypothetical protein
VPAESARSVALERDLSRIWHAERLPAELRLTDGRRIHIVYRGVWSNSDGPDFRDAMIELDGELLRGPVEIHVRSSDWRRHGHDTDPAYDDVMLHVVGHDDLHEPVRTAAGRGLPTLELGMTASDALPLGPPGAGHSLSRLGRDVCLPTLAGGREGLVRAAIREKGWERLVAKQMRLSQAMAVTTASEVLHHALLDALGFSGNRDGMARVAEHLPLATLERLLSTYGPDGAASALLGVGGFLPLSPAHQGPAEVSETLARAFERLFREVLVEHGLEPVPPGSWSLNRVRPANHPARRLMSLASLVAAAAPDGLLMRVLGLPLDGGRAWDRWLATARPALGETRRSQIITNVLAPFLAAYAEIMRDDDLAQEVAEQWELLPGSVDDRVARSAKRQIAGKARFQIRTALEEQGLHQIARFGCAELRCFECPIATLAVRHEAWLGASSPVD